MNPDHARSHEALALLYAESGQKEAALRHARQALALDPTRPQAIALLAQLVPRAKRPPRRPSTRARIKPHLGLVPQAYY